MMLALAFTETVEISAGLAAVIRCVECSETKYLRHGMRPHGSFGKLGKSACSASQVF
jgi:hypothetical protein